jgi:hypothetical protein
MKHARTMARAAAMSFALLALSNGADAAPLSGAWYGVIASVNPAWRPFTRSIRANAAERLMTLSWQCAQRAQCSGSVTGGQLEQGSQHWLLPPGGAVMPGELFILTPNADCAARYGSTARAGVWLAREGFPVVSQCFTTMQSLNTRPPPGAPPIRLSPITVPRELLERAPRP